MLGTPRYMAPEQAAGRKGLTVAADVYSLGVILYERLTGQTPFTAENVLTLLRQVQESEPPRPSSIRPGLDRDLETIALKCLEKEPSRRYESAAALADDLGRWLAGEPIEARRVSGWERARKWARRRPAAASLVLVSVVAALMLVGLAVAARYNRLLQVALDAEATQRAEVERRERESRSYWYAADIGLAGRYLSNGRVARAVELLKHQIPSTGSPDLRGFEWHYLWRLCHLARGRLSGLSIYGGTLGLAFAPGGTTLIVGDCPPLPDDPTSWSGRIAEWDPVSGRRFRTLWTSESPEALRFGPQGLLALGKAGLWAGDVSSGRMRVVRERGTFEGLLALAPDGKVAVLYSTWGEPAGLMRFRVVIDLEAGREVGTYPVALGWPSLAAISPDGKTLAIATDGGEDEGANRGNGTPIALRDLASGRPIRRFRSGVRFVRCLAFAADGKTLIVGGSYDIPPTHGLDARKPGEIELWDLSGPEPRRASRLEGHEGGTRCLAVSPDGKTLASGGGDRIVKLWRLVAEEGRQHSGFAGERRTAFRGHEADVNALAFSPDGKTLASSDDTGTVLTWDASNDAESRLLSEQPSDIIAFSFPDGGRTLLSADSSGVTSFDTASGRATGRLDTDSMLFQHRVTISPDGKTLAEADQAGVKVRLWDVDGQRVKARLPLEGERREVEGLTFSPDGMELALAGEPSKPAEGETPWVQVWDLTTLRPRLKLEGAIAPLAFSPGGRFLATASPEGHSIQLRDASDGRVIATWSDPDGRKLGRLVFSPDGTLLASGFWSSQGVLIWDVAQGRIARELPTDGAACPRLLRPTG